MAIRFCPICNSSYMYDTKSGDYVHQCNSGDDVFDKEDVPVISTTSNEFGSIVNTGKLQASITKQGLGNRLQGTRAGHEGNRLGDFTIRGNRRATHRQRQRFVYIPADKC